MAIRRGSGHTSWRARRRATRMADCPFVRSRPDLERSGLRRPIHVLTSAPARATCKDLSEWGPIDYLDGNTLIANGSWELENRKAGRSFASPRTAAITDPAGRASSLDAALLLSAIILPYGAAGWALPVVPDRSERGRPEPSPTRPWQSGRRHRLPLFDVLHHSEDRSPGKRTATGTAHYQASGHRWSPIRAARCCPTVELAWPRVSQRDSTGVMWSEA